MRRKGLVDLLVTPLVFALIIVMLWLGAQFAGMVAEKSAGKASLFYDQQSMGEVIDAPCAVDSRGVFYRSAIENGEFECLNPQGTVMLKFQLEDEQYRWSVKQTDSGAEVGETSAGLENPQKYTVLVYDREEGTKTPAVLEVAAG